MAPSSLGKRTADCKSPQNWLMGLAMDLAALCDCGGENGTNGSHFPVFSKDIAFAPHSVAPRPPPIILPYRSASGIGYASTKLSKMVGSPASYPVYSRYNELLSIAIDFWKNMCWQLQSFLRYIELIISKWYF